MAQPVKLARVKKRLLALRLLSLRDDSKGLLILLDGLPESLKQFLRINRASNDPGVHLRLLLVRVVLAEVKQELDGVVADLEVISISPFNRVSTPKALVVRTHQPHPTVSNQVSVDIPPIITTWLAI